MADQVSMIHQGRIVVRGDMDDILSRHRCVTVRWPASQESAPDLPGALSWEGEGREWTALTNGQFEQFEAAVVQAGAEIVDEHAPSLDEIFIASARTPGTEAR